MKTITLEEQIKADFTAKGLTVGGPEAVATVPYGVIHARVTGRDQAGRLHTFGKIGNIDRIVAWQTKELFPSEVMSELSDKERAWVQKSALLTRADNPPPWVKNAQKWREAKEIVEKATASPMQYKPRNPWAVVVKLYRRLIK